MSSILEVNLNNIKFNLNKIKNILKNNETIICMVKANAYGFGDIEIAKYLEECNINFFGVATVSEGINLRKNNIKGNILVTGGFLEEDINDIVKYNLTVCGTSIKLLEKLNSLNETSNIHIKVSTGMNRIGFRYDEVVNKVKYIKENFKNLNIEGIYTHLTFSETNNNITKEQIEKFDNIIEELSKENIHFKYTHIFNSSGIVNYYKPKYTAVRLGILLYGLYPDEYLKNKIEIKSCCKLKVPVVNTLNIKKGETISYNNTFKAVNDMNIAVIQIGYADGFDRELSNKKINKIDILGKVCMDMTIIKNNKYEIGDYVYIFESNDEIDNIANSLDTINYEIISRIGNRVRRIYNRK